MSTSQTWDPDGYARNARFVADLGIPVVELLDPQPGERILDIGCGDGALTEKLVAVGCSVVGVDSSPEFIAAAITRGLDARLVDAQHLDFDCEFDAVFSNAALHWMKQPDAVIAGVWRALRTGGRFAGEMGGRGNVGAIQAALHVALARRGIDPQPYDPWYYPTPDEYRSKLEAAGFWVKTLFLFERPTTLPGDLEGWLRTFAVSFLAALPAAEHKAVMSEVREELYPLLYKPGSGQWVADYVRLRFSAFRN